MLEVDGRCYTQSTAIYKLVARRGGLYPSDDAEASYIVDSVMAHCEDAFPLCYQALRGQVSREELADTLVPKRTPRAPRSHTPTPTASSAEPFSLDGPRGNRNLPSADTTLSVRAQTSATWSGPLLAFLLRATSPAPRPSFEGFRPCWPPSLALLFLFRLFLGSFGRHDCRRCLTRGLIDLLHPHLVSW